MRSNYKVRTVNSCHGFSVAAQTLHSTLALIIPVPKRQTETAIMSRIQVGTLIYDFQAIDVVGPFDLLNSIRQDFLKGLTLFGPIAKATLARAPEFDFHHIGLTRDPVPLLSSSLRISPTTTLAECPELDYLLIGGPDQEFKLAPEFAEFIRRHVAAGKLLFTTCTGASVIASTGVLDGKNATINNVEYEYFKKRYPQVKWTREKKWVVDGNIWTGSGAVASMDMIAHWIKESYGLDVLIEACKSLDYEPRDIDGLFTVIPKRYDSQGNQVSTLEFFYH
ncbi:class I glutamine amidotransferase-like protein [Ilyonectria robusta]|uniref:class I glutamine amidotransferase-like protein n=1 Tax=Ilyonectria robusta TaxID=1079257 RepID=UPI001E8E16C8|nr:class I glutamine amidotransferase-like protein [Ilyonectria robusta]KAH8667913.1 class I glutamine amidotransferase-like protein [Ilyonectria robusta]